MGVRPHPDISCNEDDTTMHDTQLRATTFARTIAEVLAELPGEEDIDASDAQTISREEALDRLYDLHVDLARLIDPLVIAGKKDLAADLAALFGMSLAPAGEVTGAQVIQAVKDRKLHYRDISYRFVCPYLRRVAKEGRLLTVEEAYYLRPLLQRLDLWRAP